MSNDDGNPFSVLIEDSADEMEKDSVDYLNETFESIFGFTLDKSKSSKYVYFEEFSNTYKTNKLNLEIVKNVLFERTLLTNPKNFMNCSSNDWDPTRCQSSVIFYLYDCFRRNKELENDTLKQDIEELILENVVTALKQPNLYGGQLLSTQLYDVLFELDTVNPQFLTSIVTKFHADGDSINVAKEQFIGILKVMHLKVTNSTLDTFPNNIFLILNNFANMEELAVIFMDYCQPKIPNSGSAYANTLLGALFNVSILPTHPSARYEYFSTSLTATAHSAMENQLWVNMDFISYHIFIFILNLLKCSPSVQLRVLTWLGDLLKTNVNRGKLWNAYAPEYHVHDMRVLNDGFMINFTSMMMKLCKPFCCLSNKEKLLKIDPTYCAVPNEDCAGKNIHLLDMSKETCLIPPPTPFPRLTNTHYHFVTECFFMAHRSIDLGFRVIADKLVKINQEITRSQQNLQEAREQQSDNVSLIETMQKQLQSDLTKYFSLKCAMTERVFLLDLFDLISSSSFWLTQVALHAKDERSTVCAPLDEKQVEFPLPENVPVTLQCIPEFMIENIVCYLIFLRRFNPQIFEERGYESLEPILTFILVYMGSSNHTCNPHLRAHLAEALESLLPYHKGDLNYGVIIGLNREMLFTQHQHRKEIISALLNVFVSIEMTGQSVQFEQKFNYRRPMYMVMDYLWEIAEHKQYFKELAQEANLNMDAVIPPLFLRFVNLLINDAIFLLDESFETMSKLREMQIARDSGEWDALPIREHTQNINYMHHLGTIARFNNILGRNTIQTIEYLTSEIVIVFTHSSMVDRVSIMLNYLLLNLVGPNKKNFKVKDNKEYSFDPAITVLNICKVYINLKNSDAFCLAVSQDGRSYNSQLFVLAEEVLVRIGGGSLITELRDMANKVMQKAGEYQKNEEALTEPPEHFLDPIMSTVMTDPVILPSSKQTVDRSTIARHLLSDQTDPFNRMPLFMDQLIPNTELAEEIKQWKEQRKPKP